MIEVVDHEGPRRRRSVKAGLSVAALGRLGVPRVSSRGRYVVFVVAALLLAVALPVAGTLFLGNRGSSAGPALTATSSPSPSVTSSTPTPASSASFSLGALTTGPLPRVRYWTDRGVSSRSLHRVPAQFSTVAAQIVDFARYEGGWVALWDGDPGNQLCFYAAGSPVPSRCLDSTDAAGDWSRGLTRSQDGYVALSLRPGQVILVDPAGTVVQTWNTGIKAALVPLAVLPDHSVVLSTGFQGEASALTVHVLANGTVRTLQGLYPTDVSRRSGLISASPGSGCAGVAALQSGHWRWTSCDYAPGIFSPDGALLVTVPRFTNPALPDTDPLLLVDSTTGKVLRRFVLPSGTHWNPTGPLAAWDDNTHVLANLYSTSDRRYFVLRFGLAGSVERVPDQPQS